MTKKEPQDFHIESKKATVYDRFIAFEQEFFNNKVFYPNNITSIILRNIKSIRSQIEKTF
jgi:hypothetical protein